MVENNISEMKRRLIIFLHIPAEAWTDVLKTIPRKNLVQNIAPACFRLKDICDKNVKSIHLIKNASQFTDKLEEGDLEANQQLEQLAANKCQLASHFRLSKMRIGEGSQAILRLCPDLFAGCEITLNLVDKENKSSTLFLECLGQLEEAKSFGIYVYQAVDQVVDFWHHPTFQNCTRVELLFRSNLSAATMTTAFVNIFDWLHQQQQQHPTDGMDCDASAIQQVRCMILCIWLSGHRNLIDWLLNRCSEDIQQARRPTDRRSFVFSFVCSNWSGFGQQFRRIENKSTGEVLLLDSVIDENGQRTIEYRLRRSLAQEIANGVEFYAKMFNRYTGFDGFNIEQKTTVVEIGCN